MSASASFDNARCGIVEGYQKATGLHKIGLAFNFATLAVFLAGEIFVFCRERFMIGHFDEDNTLPDDNLRAELRLYPSIKTILHRMNIAAVSVSFLMVCMEITNFVISMIVIVRISKATNAGNGSVAQVIANVLLVLGKVVGYFFTSKQSFTTRGAISMITVTPKEHNTVDSNYKFQPGYYVESAEKKPTPAAADTPAPAAADTPAPAAAAANIADPAEVKVSTE